MHSDGYAFAKVKLNCGVNHRVAYLENSDSNSKLIISENGGFTVFLKPYTNNRVLDGKIERIYSPKDYPFTI